MHVREASTRASSLVTAVAMRTDLVRKLQLAPVAECPAADHFYPVTHGWMSVSAYTSYSILTSSRCSMAMCTRYETARSDNKVARTWGLTRILLLIENDRRDIESRIGSSCSARYDPISAPEFIEDHRRWKAHSRTPLPLLHNVSTRADCALETTYMQR